MGKKDKIDDKDNLDDELVNLGSISGDISDDVDPSDDELAIEEDEIDIMIKFGTNNHKIEGKHSLKRDTIFKGKVEKEPDQHSYIMEDYPTQDGFPIEAGSAYEFESKHNAEYVNRIDLSNDVYRLLQENTELDFTSNRRKPNKQAFNDYYRMLLDKLCRKYSKSEIFVELSYYFTDNIFNMFKLLDKEYATQIIIELKQSGYLDNLNNINFI
jgi:hypothetical protein